VKSLTKFILFSGDSAKILPDADKQRKAIAKLLKGKADLNIRVFWVGCTAPQAPESTRSCRLAPKATIATLKKYGVKATFTYAAKESTGKGDYTDRRAEIDATYTE
jgi:outer membrane protein OmpA-like peptidoglycan-associated protein